MRFLQRDGTQMEPAEPEPIATARFLRTASAEAEFQPPRGVAAIETPDVWQVRSELERTIVGQAAAIEGLMIALIAGGHVLLEGAPGLGKTTACRTMARALDAKYSRVQCNADLTPADLSGSEVFDQRDLSFQLRLGPVFANVVLVDEINRAPARVQAALLEAMAERSVTIGTETLALPDPFFVLATMNEAEADGIFPLPAAQLDRFLLKIVLDFPSAEEDVALLERRETGAGVSPHRGASLENVRVWQAACRTIYCAPALTRYVAEIVRVTRAAAECGDLESGAGPRAGLSILRAARARAILAERNYVLPADVRSVALAGLAHRVTFAHSYLSARAEREERLHSIIDRVPLP
ncbi:MAG TPA: AAA family ATPase [Candidatus Rubrimentiphilum sp.]|nr:AAA family ATPase [Candidatus Rubrimentiphilum sp.]